MMNPKIEDRLVDRHHLLSDIIQSSMDAIITVDDEQQVILFNQAAEHLFQCSGDAAIGQPLDQFLPARFRNMHRHHITTFGQTGSTTRTMGALGQVLGLRGNGEEFPLEATISKIIIEGKTYYTAILRDATERKRMDDVLRRQERHLNTAQAIAHVGSWEWDIQNNTAIWSAELFRIFGYAPESFTPTYDTFLNALHPDDRAHTIDLVHKAVENTGIYDHEVRIVRPSGEIRWIHSRGEVDHGGKGQPLTMAVTVQDITERKRAEAMLRESEARFSLAFNEAAIGMNLSAPDGRFLQVNRALCHIVGRSKEELEATTFQALTHPDDLVADLVLVDQLLKGQIPHFHMEKRYIHKMGHLVWVLLSVSLVRDAEGVPRYFISQVQDITKRKRADAVLHEEQSILKLIAGGVTLPAILAVICQSVEKLGAQVQCSILLFDESAGCLRHGAAPSLPGEYNQAVDGLVIGVAVGSCGTAAYRHAPVIVMDIETDPLWPEAFRTLALRHGLRACWSTPIVGTTGAVLGTFAMYYATPRGPQEDEQELVSRATYLAAIAIEQTRTDERLQETTRVLRQHQDELQALTGKLFTAQEEERRRIARDLHDDFNQRLAMLAIEVGGVKRELPSSPLQDRVAAVHQQIKTLADDVHTLAYQLHPSLLDDVGLEAVLRDLLETFSRHTTIPTRLTTRHVLASLPRPQAGGIYRIVQESLQNVAKYARASEVVVRVRGMKTGLALIIRDNGVGFDAGLMGTPQGLGLQSLRERARLLGGVVRIRSRVGTGTRIGAWIP